jgi:hypothetical protein
VRSWMIKMEGLDGGSTAGDVCWNRGLVGPFGSTAAGTLPPTPGQHFTRENPPRNPNQDASWMARLKCSCVW